MAHDKGATVMSGHSDVAFSDEAMAAYREILTHYPERRAALMPVLWLAQREFGWISTEVMAYVAELMQLPMAWVEGVATFYTMYNKKPVGKFHVQVCQNISCHLRGSDRIMGALQRRLNIGTGETTSDGMFTLSRVECLGSCGTAPMLQLNDRFLENLDVQQVLDMVDKLKKGEEV
jgi:NADH-quinone oxidoreductase E subunit